MAAAKKDVKLTITGTAGDLKKFETIIQIANYYSLEITESSGLQKARKAEVKTYIKSILKTGSVKAKDRPKWRSIGERVGLKTTKPSDG